MIVSDSTYKKEFSSISLGILKPEEVYTKEIYIYNNNTALSILIEGTGDVFDDEWMQLKCDSSSIAWTKLNGATPIALGTWTGYRKVEIKTTVPTGVEYDLFTFNFKLNTESMYCYLAVNYNLSLTTIINEDVFGIVI